MPSSVATGDFGPAPPGLDMTENQTGDLLGAVVPVAVFGTIAVSLRLVARLRTKDVTLAIDDYLIIAALVSLPLPCMLRMLTLIYRHYQVFSWGTAISCFLSRVFRAH